MADKSKDPQDSSFDSALGDSIASDHSSYSDSVDSVTPPSLSYSDGRPHTDSSKELYLTPDLAYYSGSSCGAFARETVKSTPTTRHLADDTNNGNYFKGNLQQYIDKLDSIADFRSWDPIKDIKNLLSKEHLEELRQLLWEQDEDKEFEAINAARYGDDKMVALALFTAKSHKQLNTMNADRQTVLHIAAEKCSPHCCRLLITRGCDGAIADVWGNTPLHIAAMFGRPEVIKALCTTLSKTEVHHPYFRVPYKSLPQDNVQSYNHDGRAPVHLAAQEPHSERHQASLKALVKYARADIDYRRFGDGYAPAHIAIDNDDYDCLEMCLRIGADSEVRNFRSETPQQMAYLCYNNDKDHRTVILCQKHGAGAYQLDYAEAEPFTDDEEMDVEEEKACPVSEESLRQYMEQMNMG
ncbi:NF-kappa-B inhibitor alpha-like isoform X2 [Watersipora subatra]